MSVGPSYISWRKMNMTRSASALIAPDSRRSSCGRLFSAVRCSGARDSCERRPNSQLAREPSGGADSGCSCCRLSVLVGPASAAGSRPRHSDVVLHLRRRALERISRESSPECRRSDRAWLGLRTSRQVVVVRLPLRGRCASAPSEVRASAPAAPCSSRREKRRNVVIQRAFWAMLSTKAVFPMGASRRRPGRWFGKPPSARRDP